MLIKEAPKGISNTKLKSCDKIINELSGDSWKVKIRPSLIYQKLAEHEIFQNFADSNQALCKKLRPFYKKLPKEGELKSKLNSLLDKIRYDGPKDNNLRKYLSNLLLYKAFILDAKDQIPPEELDKCKIDYQCKKELDEKKKALDKCQKDRDKSKIVSDKSRKDRDKSKIESDSSKKILDSHMRNPEACEKALKSYIDNLKEDEKLEKQYRQQPEDELKKELDEFKKTLSESKKNLDSHMKDPEKYEDALDSYINNLELYNDALEKYEEYLESYELYSEKYSKSLIEYQNHDGYNKLKKYESLKEYKSLKECEKLDYKVSIHIRFARTMNALNAYTTFPIEILEKYITALREAGISDEYGWKVIKQRNLMKLERHKINRYVTVQDGGIYTTVVADKEEHLHERTKFKYEDKETSSDESVPIWDYSKHKDEDTYTLEQRIKHSCENFNKQIDKHVISTYANYYCTNNVLTVVNVGKEVGKDDKRLYLQYEYDKDSEGTVKKLEIPRATNDERKDKEEAPLHVLLNSVKNEMYNPTNNFCYEPLFLYQNRNEATDIGGILYAIRKKSIAVSCNAKEEGFHSSMWSGKKVQAAGLLCAWNGKLIAVDNMSGHYKPNWYLFYMAWKPFYDGGKGVFHKKALLGICVCFLLEDEYGRSNTVSYNQFFEAKTFMKLAEKDFEIGETVKELERHLTEMNKIKKFQVIEQTNETCDNVIMSPHMFRYHEIWGDENRRNQLACEFIMSMKYDWGEIIPKAINSYKGFPAKGGKYFSWFFNLCEHLKPNTRTTENILKIRTKKLQKIITTCKESIEKVNEKIKLEEERKKELKTATDKYKEVLSNIGTNSNLNSNQKYDLIKCIAEIYFANRAYSILAASVGGYDKDIIKYQKRIGEWVSLLEPILQVKADKKAGLGYDGVGMVEGEIHLPEPKPSSNEESSTGEKQEDHLGNCVDLPSGVKAKLPLVDPSTYKPPVPTTQQPKKSQPKTTTPKKSQSEGGERFRCNDCGKEVVIYDVSKKHICPECGHMGCLDPKKKI